MLGVQMIIVEQIYITQKEIKMSKNDKALAIIAARGGSKGLPRKNLRMLEGLPLVAWPILAALGARSVNRVIISTDDNEIATAARAVGADVPFMRPAYLANDTASSMDVVLHALNFLEAQGEKYEHVILLEPTSPLTESSDIEAALSQLRASSEIADSIVGISHIEAMHPEYDVIIGPKGLIRPYTSKNFNSLPRRQDIEKIYFLEGSVYISKVEAFLKNRTFYHERTIGYEVPRWKSLEVDDLLDFYMVETVMKKRKELTEIITRKEFN